MLETKKRTLIKSILWRLFATTNSFLVLCLSLNNALKSAILMNITGLIIYYLYERIWNKVKWGRK
jgi:uncharacterized membrane protein